MEKLSINDFLKLGNDKPDLLKSYTELYSKFTKKWNCDIFFDSPSGDIYFRCSIPAEKLHIEGLRYDTIIRVIGDRNIPNFLDRQIQVFSNSPSFTFMYAYVFNQKGLILQFARPKMSPKSLKQPPVKRNPNNEMGAEKSLYFSMLYIKQNFDNEVRIIKKAKKFDKKTVIHPVMTSLRKIESYQKIDKRRKVLEKRDKERKERRKNRLDKYLDMLKSGRIKKLPPSLQQSENKSRKTKKIKARKAVKSTINRK